MIDLGMGFVSKCSQTFTDKTKEKIQKWSVGTKMYQASGKQGLWISDELLNVQLSKERTEQLRFVAFMQEVKVERAVEKVRDKAIDDANSIIESFRGRRFETEEAALKALTYLKLDSEGPFSFKVGTAHYTSEHPEDVPDWWELVLEPLISDKTSDYNLRSRRPWCW